MTPHLEIMLISIFMAVSCAIPGNFLVLRKMSMMSDAITHTILLGIVLAFFVTKNLSSPLLIIGAAIIGVLTVMFIELLSNTKLLPEDASIGIVFPLFFSIAIILISKYAGNVHLDTDSVLLGELAFAPFDRFIIFGKDIGAKAIYTTGFVLILNIILVTIFFKELKIATFDPLFASIIGFYPVIIYYSFMTIVSITTVVSFQAVGSILVVSFMVGPSLTAFLITKSLKYMIIISGVLGAVSSMLGYQLAMLLDVSIAGSMAVVVGIIFFIVFICSPKYGLIMNIRNKKMK